MTASTSPNRKLYLKNCCLQLVKLRENTKFVHFKVFWCFSLPSAVLLFNHSVILEQGTKKIKCFTCLLTQTELLSLEFKILAQVKLIISFCFLFACVSVYGTDVYVLTGVWCTSVWLCWHMKALGDAGCLPWLFYMLVIESAHCMYSLASQLGGSHF